MINNCTFIGRTVNEPELKYTSNGTPYALYTLAVEENYKKDNGEKEVQYIDMISWGKQAEFVAENLGKGKLVGIKGRLQIRKNKTDKGTYINPQIKVEEVQMLEWKDSGENDVNENMQSEDDLPDDDFEVPW